MKIVIEKELKKLESFPNKKVSGARWYVAKQEALMFKEGETYPDKYQHTLAFSDSEQSTVDVRPLVAGTYELDQENAFYIKNGSLCCDCSKLKLLKVATKSA